MTLPLPWGDLHDPQVRENFEKVAQQFPIDGVNAATFGKNYRTVAQAGSRFLGATAAALYLPIMSGFSVANGTATNNVGAVFTLDPADYAITGMTTKYRLRVLTVTNNTAPGINYTFGLHSLTSIAGGGGALTYTLNATAVSGSTVTLTAPVSSSGNSSLSAQFTPPAAGLYGFGILTSGASAATADVGITMLLQAVNA